MEPPKTMALVPKKARTRVQPVEPEVEEIPRASSSELRFP
jgi:hypothetical protein